jgi:hypothetical protein
MNPFVTAALLMCSNGDPIIAGKIAHEAIVQDTDIVVALTVGILESGLGRNSHDNPMGVRGCYPMAKRKMKRSTDTCIRIGITSLHNRLWDAKVSKPSKAGIRECQGNAMCRALVVYNGSKNKYVYARKGMYLIHRIYKLAGASVPTT